MKVTGYSWFGVRSDDLDETAKFFNEVLGLKTSFAGKKIATLELPSGQALELVSPQSRWAPFHESPVLAFDVDDIHAAKAEMEAQGVKFLSEISTAGGSSGFCYFEGPDGIVYSLSQSSEEA